MYVAHFQQHKLSQSAEQNTNIAITIKNEVQLNSNRIKITQECLTKPELKAKSKRYVLSVDLNIPNSGWH